MRNSLFGVLVFVTVLLSMGLTMMIYDRYQKKMDKYYRDKYLSSKLPDYYLPKDSAESRLQRMDY